jgi:predicted DNA binding CopG/RHH family protein
MQDIQFDWDPAKARANLRKHGEHGSADPGRGPCLPVRPGHHPHHLGSQGHQGGASHLRQEASPMRKEYDFSNARPNPYAKRLKRSVTIRLDEGTIEYFKDLAAETGIPYQTLINSYLRECAATRRRLTMRWVETTKGAA